RFFYIGPLAPLLRPKFFPNWKGLAFARPSAAPMSRVSRVRAPLARCSCAMLDAACMRHLLLGAAGQLAYDLLHVFHESYPADQVIAATHQDIEISNEAAVRELVSRVRPETVINTAAYNRVDDCEINPGIAFTVNAAAP